MSLSPFELSEIEEGLLDTSARRAAVYAEIARPSWNNRIEHDGFIQHIDGLPDLGGVAGLTHISVCRMGDMRTAFAVVSADGPGGSAIVTVRTQFGTEAYGVPSLVYDAGVGGGIIGVSLCSAYNPIFNTGARRSAERTLICAVWEGSVPTSLVRIFVSNDRGTTWTQVWQTNGSGVYMEQPKLLTHATTGEVYLFFYDNTSNTVEYVRNADPPEEWPLSTFNWTGSGTIHTFPTTARHQWDVAHDPVGWLFAYLHVTTGQDYVELGSNSNADPASGAWVFLAGSTYIAVGSTWVSVCRTGGNDEFGDFPAGRALVVIGGGTRIFFNFANETQWINPYFYYMENNGGSHWQSINYGFYQSWVNTAPIEYSTQFDNRLIWRTRTTPSTSIEYGQDDTTFPGVFTDWVKIDNHGPTVDDDDIGDHFASFWTRSDEHGAVALPPYDALKDLTIEFAVKFHKAEYHNIWFVIDDPLHPNTPLLKLDFYEGRDATGGHPHDTARGLRIWFCKRATAPDHPVSNPDAVHGENPAFFQHPLDYMFDGFDDASGNAGPFYFKIEYTHTDDMFRLFWNKTGTGSYEPFIPYDTEGDTREFVDVGTEDAYVASDTEKYHTQPRGDIWPRRFYIGCPEVKPALEKQSGITIGYMFLYDPNQDETDARASGRGCLVRRLSGGIDFWFVDYNFSDLIRRLPYGYEWQDVWTAQKWESTWSMNVGPDSGTLTFLDIDNSERSSLYENVRGWKGMMWCKAGSLEGGVSASEQLWGRWVCPFFGVADTGEAIDSGEGPQIVMRMLSPIAQATRSYRTQTFTALPPPEVLDAEGEPVDPVVQDEPKVRAQEVIYLVDFDAPADPALNLFDDYIPGYVWDKMLGLPLTKLSVPRVGIQPANFTVNSGGTDSDLWEDIRRFWDDLGLVWFYDYFTGGVLRAARRVQLQGTGAEGLANAEYTLKGWKTLAAPLTRSEDDFGRAGNVQTSTRNAEDRPNVAVARVAPWPDGTGTVDKALDIVGSRYSQWALAEMYKKDLPLQALYKEWETARQESPEVLAWPYIMPTQLVWIDVDNSEWPSVFRNYILSRFGKLQRLWLVYGVETEWDSQNFVSRPLLVDPNPFPV